MGNKTLAFLITIVPIANIYKFPFLINNFGNALILFFCLPIVLFHIIKNKDLIIEKSSIKYLYFSFYIIAISFYYLLSCGNSESIKALVYFIVFTFIFLLFISYKSFFSIFIKYYKRLSVFFSIYLIVQFVSYKIFAFEFTGIIPFLSTYIDITDEAFAIGHNNIVKISSFFIEPSHFALYVLPALCIYLWNIDTSSKHRTIPIIIIVAATLFSTSANGIVLLSIIFSLYILNKYFKKFKIKHILIGLITFIILIVFLINSSLIKSATYGLFVVEEDRSESKADARIYRGFLFYNDLEINNQIFGIGWKNAENFAKTEKNQILYNRYYLKAFDYFNSISAFLIYSGIIGLFLFLSFIWSIWKATSNFGGKVIIIIILASMTSSSIIMTEIWPLYLTIFYSLTNINPKETNLKNESNNYFTHT